MPFNGSGTYVPPGAPDFPAIAGTTIVASYYNNVINDIATALSLCLTKDGQAKPTAAIDWNAKDLTNIAHLQAVTATIGALTLTTPLSPASGGAGVDLSAAANGKLLIGNGAGMVLGNITGDANIQVTNNAGTIGLAYVGGGGSVSSVNASTSLSGLTFSGGPITTSGTLALAGILGVASGGTGSNTAAGALAALGGATGGAITGSGLTMATGRLLGRTTAATGAIEEITAGATLSLTAGSLGVASVPNACTFNNGGSGAVSGTTFNGSAARTVSYNTIGAMPDTQRVQSAASGNLTPVGDTDDICIRTALAAAPTINAPTGSPWQGRGMVIRLKDNGTARAITWNTIYRSCGSTLPTTTVVNKTTYVGLIYNSTDTKWDCVSVATEA